MWNVFSYMVSIKILCESIYVTCIFVFPYTGVYGYYSLENNV